MRVLVTGHNGYLGSVMVDLLVSAGHDVTGLDTDFYEDCAFGSERAKVPAMRADVRHVDTAHLAGFEAVIHLAALPSDPSGSLDRQTAVDVNHLASVRLARHAREAGVRRFLFASCTTLYRAAGSDLLTEEAGLEPLTSDAESKLLAERDVARLATERFTPVFLRSATAYGASPRLRADLLVNRLLGYAVTTGNIPIRGNGSTWQPVVHVEDVARAFLAALEASRDLVHNRAFNVGRTRENYKIRDIAQIIREEVPGSRITYELDEANSGGYRLNCDELAWMVPAFQPRWTLRDGIRDLHEAYRRHGITYDKLTGAGSRYLRVKYLRRLQSIGLLEGQMQRTVGLAATSMVDEPAAATAGRPLLSA